VTNVDCRPGIIYHTLNSDKQQKLSNHNRQIQQSQVSCTSGAWLKEFQRYRLRNYTAYKMHLFLSLYYNRFHSTLWLKNSP